MGSLLGKDAGSPPPPPDPTATANAQSAAAIQTASAQARLNRINQTTPFGSIKYTQTGVDEHGVPIYSSNISLSPQQQQLLNQQQSGTNTRQQIANMLLNRSAASLATPLDLSHLSSVYDKYAPTHEWNGNAPQQAQPFSLQDLPTGDGSPAASPAAPTPGASSAPSAPSSAQSPQIDPSQIASLIAMLRGGQQGQASTTQPTQLDTSGQAPNAPDGASPFGSLGNLQDRISRSGQIVTDSKMDDLPPWLKSQFNVTQQGNGGDDGGSQSMWQIGDGHNPFGGYKDANGNYMVQIGDPSNWKGVGEDGGVKDKSKVTYDPQLGYVTSPDNVSDVAHHNTGKFIAAYLAMVGGAGLAGLGADAGVAAEGGGAALGDSEQALASQQLAGSGASSGGVGGGVSGGVVGGSEGAMPGYASEAQAAGGNYAPVTDLSTSANSSPLDQIMQNLKSGKGALGFGGTGAQRAAIGMALAQLLRSRPTQQQQVGYKK